MTSFRDIIQSCKYDDNNQVKFSHQRNHRNEMKSALEHICRLGWRQFVSWRHLVILVTSWRHVMTWRHHASIYTIFVWNPAIEIITEIHVHHHFRTSTSWYRRSEFCDIMTSRHDVMTSWKHRNDNILELVKPENYRNEKKNHLFSTSTSWDRVPPVFDVMTWRHDVTSSCNYETSNIFELSNPKFHRNKKRIIFLAHLQAEIWKISLDASCCDVMMSQCHAVGLNQNLSTLYLVNGTWSYEKMVLSVEAKLFSYKIIVILCQSVFRASWSNHVSVLFQKASENFSVSNSMSYHAVYVVSFIIYLILTVNCRTVSKSVHCPFVMACQLANLKLNRSKTKEIVVHRPRAKNLLFPPAVDGVERLDVINVLGVLVDSTLSFRAQVDRLVGQSAQTLYALRILKHHGLCGPPLWNVATATLLSRLLYASPVWWGMVDAGGRHRLQSVLNRAVKQGFLPKDQASLELLCDSADMKLFASILRNPQHVLHQFLPPVKHTTHNLRSRAHNRVLPNVKDSLFRKTFINRMIFHDCY